MATSDNQDLDNSQKAEAERIAGLFETLKDRVIAAGYSDKPVSYTHLRAHET